MTMIDRPPPTKGRMIERAVEAAEGIMRIHKILVDEAERNEKDPMKRCWYRQDARQAHIDCLTAMRFYGLIKDFSLSTCKAIPIDP